MPSRFRFARSAASVAAAVFLAVLSAQAPAAAAQGLTMTAAMEVSQLYRADAWQAVRIHLHNDTDRPIDGTAVVPLSHPNAPAVMQLPLSVPPRASVAATVWGYFPLPSEQAAAQPGGVPPLTVAQWRGPDGALLARSDVLGIPITFRGGVDAAYGERGELVLLVTERGEIANDAYDADALVDQVADAAGLTMAVAGVTRDVLPRQAAGLRAVKAVVLDAVDPQSLDHAQRQALLTYLHGGGIVVVSAPLASAGRAGSWFDPYFPVRLIGSRMAEQVETGNEGSHLKLREPLPIVEAVEADGGEVLLRGTDYVHVATKSVGLGKVVFTSFPLNGLAEDQPQVAVLWEHLLDVRRPLWDWGGSQLADARYGVLGAMIGRKVAPWPVAAAVAGGYVLLVVVAQALFLGPARPRAFVASAAVAVVVSGAVLAMGMSRRDEGGLQAARLAVVDVGPAGHGWRQESFAFVGADEPNLSLRAAGERVMIRPALADEGNPPTVRQQPFGVDQTGVHAERIERVWEAAGPADPTWRISAIGRFGPQGLALEVDNGTGLPLHAPLVIWQGRALTMEDLPSGLSAVNSIRFNERGNFTPGGVLTTDQAKRRALVVKASLTPANAPATTLQRAPLFIAWLPDEVGGELARPADQHAITRKSMIMVRTPLRIEPTATGGMISVPAALVRVDTGRLPYDHEAGESIATPQPGSWQVSFAAPAQAGRVRPTRMILTARVTLPAHSLTVRKGASPLVEWSGEIGQKELVIDCAPGDADEHGRVTLTIDVQSLDVTGGVPWQISNLAARIEGEVIGPPAPIVLDVPLRAGSPQDDQTIDQQGPF